MKKKIIFALNLIWAGIVSFTLPYALLVHHMNLSGNGKGYGYDLGAEGDIYILFGAILLIVWLCMAIPSFVYVLKKAGKKSPLWAAGLAVLFLLLAVVGVYTMGGWQSFRGEFRM